MSDGNVIRSGDVMRFYTSGGGGWGDPLDRPIADVRGDVLGVFVSPESARENYGVVIDARGVIDDAATALLREAKRGPIRMFHRNGYFGPPARRLGGHVIR
jgi:N-methylhydantoinase B